jgi:hypothetical protein
LPIPPIEPGDTFLLFHKFPYDFETDLPINAGPAVYLDKAPQDVLDSADPRGLADYVYPGYSFDGGLVNCCLRKPATSSLPEGLTATHALFLSVGCLRLAAPFGIEVSGQFVLEDSEARIGSPTMYCLQSCWQPGHPGGQCYSGTHLEVADRLAQQIIRHNESKRIMSAYTLFVQVTIGMTSSLQMATMGFFAALEALFVPNGNKAKTLAARVARFLGPIAFPFDVAAWLEEEYQARRNSLAHGVQDILPWSPSSLDPEKGKALGRLHELVRLSVIGFLSLPDELIQNHSMLNGSRLRDLLDTLSPVDGGLIAGQRAWCD